MNAHRVDGVVDQAVGKIKQGAGHITGDAKLETEGKAQVVAGKIKNAAGGVEDAVHEHASH